MLNAENIPAILGLIVAAAIIGVGVAVTARNVVYGNRPDTEKR